MELRRRAQRMIAEFWGDSYIFGSDALTSLDEEVRALGERPLVVGNVRFIGNKLQEYHIVPGTMPNTPIADVDRLRSAILVSEPDCLVAVGGGSTIDGVKAAAAWAALGGDLEQYFGTGRVIQALEEASKKLLPIMAVQTVAGSGAHLTKYSNVTLANGQKKLMVDEALIPAVSMFDYSVTATVPVETSLDGALDAMSHLIEVYFGAGQDHTQLAELVEVGLPLILRSAPRLRLDRTNSEVREELGLASDLGAMAIMLGGTNGPHLTSFSLVNLASHGRACAILGPYYTAFFAQAITPQLRVVARILAEYDYLSPRAVALVGRELGQAVAEGMLAFLESLGYPTSLGELPGFTNSYIERALQAAADPQLAMKLQNMPIPFRTEDIENYMRPLLEAAVTGDLSLVP